MDPSALRTPCLAVLVAGLAPGCSSQPAELIGDGHEVRYLANGADPAIGSTWTQAGFDDRGWSRGVVGLGYEEGSGAEALIATAVPRGTVSILARTTFDVPDLASVRSVHLGADYDDGWAAWLNGVEIHRSPELPAGPLAWDSVPAPHESSNGTSPRFDPYADVTETALPVLRATGNVLAIGVWNTEAASSDLLLVPRLVVNELPTLVRGPYLQSLTPTSTVVRWRTDRPADSRLRIADGSGRPPRMLGSDLPRTEHAVVATGLHPETEYGYEVGSSAGPLAGSGASLPFRTPPPAGARRHLRFWVLGDSGTANDDARAVRDAYLASEPETGTDGILMLGDNAYESGTDAEYQAAVFDTFSEIIARSPLWPTYGNHDARSADADTQTGVYFDTFDLPADGAAGGVPSGTEAYYSFDVGNVHFACLESEESDRSPSGPMLTWLDADLAATTQEWVIAYWHHPPYSKGSHDSDAVPQLTEVRQRFLPVLEARGVDLVLTGHSHSYERTPLIDGHLGDSSTFGPAFVLDGGDGRLDGDGPYLKPSHGTAPHEGEVHVVAGSSGKVSGGPLDHPAMLVSLGELGSLVLEVEGDRLDVRFLSADGSWRDAFSLRKGCARRPCPESDCSDGLDEDADGAVDGDDDDCAGSDRDGDGRLDWDDCAPDDPTVQDPPGPVTRLDVRREGATRAMLGWPLPQETVDGMEILRGDLDALRRPAPQPASACVQTGPEAESLGDDALPPDGGTRSWYLLRAIGPCGPGDVGGSAPAGARLALATCP